MGKRKTKTKAHILTIKGPKLTGCIKRAKMILNQGQMENFKVINKGSIGFLGFGQTSAKVQFVYYI